MIKRCLLGICIFTVCFFSRTGYINAATTTTNAKTFVSSFTVVDAPLAVDDVLPTYAVVSNPSGGLDGRFIWSSSDIPEDATVTQYDFQIWLQGSYAKPGCTRYVSLTDNDPITAGVEVGTYSFVGEDGYTLIEFTLSPSINTTAWNSSLYDINDPGSFTVTVGLGGGDCITSTTRHYHEAYTTITYEEPPPDIITVLSDILDAITSIPSTILSGIYNFFIPDFSEVADSIDATRQNVLSKRPLADFVIIAQSIMDYPFSAESGLQFNWAYEPLGLTGTFNTQAPPLSPQYLPIEQFVYPMRLVWDAFMNLTAMFYMFFFVARRMN